jgi:hypothetical protein
MDKGVLEMNGNTDWAGKGYNENHDCNGENYIPIRALKDPSKFYYDHLEDRVKFINPLTFRSKFDLSIVCFLWGDWCGAWGIKYVNYLYRAVQRHLTWPHRFILFTDICGSNEANLNEPYIQFDRGIQIIPTTFPRWKWNLKKMIMYKSINGLTGRVLCLDLDMIILDSIDELVTYPGEFITCASPFRSRKGNIGGSLIGFEVGFGEKELYEPLKNLSGTDLKIMERKTEGGSERKYYTLMLDRKRIDFWQDLYPGQVVSFKNECKSGIPPEGAKIVRFHGLPRPHQRLDLDWVKDNWNCDR